MNFTELNKYSLVEELLKKVSFLASNEKKSKKEIKKVKKENLIFFPKFSDTLFWCYYILINSIQDYEMVNSDFKEEKMIKISLIQNVRENKEILKKLRIKRTEVEDDLLNKKSIGIKTFLLLCHLKKINIIIRDNIKFIENISNCEDPNIQIIEKRKGKYGLFIGKKEIEKCREEYWKVDGMDFQNPLKSISHYKLKNLQDICNKLNLIIEKDGKKLRKKDLYQMIYNKIE